MLRQYMYSVYIYWCSIHLFRFVWFPHAINFAIRRPIILDSHVFFHRLLSSISTTTVVFCIDFLISTNKIVKSMMHYFSATTFHFQWLIIPSSVQDEEPSMAESNSCILSRKTSHRSEQQPSNPFNLDSLHPNANIDTGIEQLISPTPTSVHLHMHNTGIEQYKNWSF